MPREDHGPYTEYLTTYTLNVPVPQFRGMYIPATGYLYYKDMNGTENSLFCRAGDYLPLSGTVITNNTQITPILLY